jgi:hypothetical protein
MPFPMVPAPTTAMVLICMSFSLDKFCPQGEF